MPQDFVDGEPDRDVRVLQDPARLLVVMREGRIVVDRRAAHPRPTGERTTGEHPLPQTPSPGDRT